MAEQTNVAAMQPSETLIDDPKGLMEDVLPQVKPEDAASLVDVALQQESEFKGSLPFPLNEPAMASQTMADDNADFAFDFDMNVRQAQRYDKPTYDLAYRDMTQVELDNVAMQQFDKLMSGLDEEKKKARYFFDVTYKSIAEDRGFDPKKQLDVAEQNRKQVERFNQIISYSSILRMEPRALAGSQGFFYGDDEFGHEVAMRRTIIESLAYFTGKDTAEISESVDAYASAVAQNIIDSDPELFRGFNPEGFKGKAVDYYLEALKTLGKNNEALKDAQDSILVNLRDNFLDEGEFDFAKFNKAVSNANLTTRQVSQLKEQAVVMQKGLKKWEPISELVNLAKDAEFATGFGKEEIEILRTINQGLKSQEDRKVFLSLLKRRSEEYGLGKSFVVRAASGFKAFADAIGSLDLAIREDMAERAGIGPISDISSKERDEIIALHNDILNISSYQPDEDVLSQILFGAAELPFMGFAAASGPGALPFYFTRFFGHDYYENIGAGVDRDTAAAFASTNALVEGGLEYLQQNFLLGRFPLVGKTMDKFFPITRAGVRLLGNVAGNTLTETAQDFSNRVNNEFLVAFERTDLDLGLLKDWRLDKALRDNFFYTIIPSIIGANGRKSLDGIRRDALDAILQDEKAIQQELGIEDQSKIDAILSQDSLEEKLDFIKENNLIGKRELQNLIARRLSTEQAMKAMVQAQELGLPMQIETDPDSGKKVAAFPTQNIRIPLDSDQDVYAAYESAMELAKTRDAKQFREAVVSYLSEKEIASAEKRGQKKVIEVTNQEPPQATASRVTSAIGAGLLDKGATAEQLRVLATNQLLYNNDQVIGDATKLFDGERLDAVTEDSAKGTLKFYVENKGLMTYQEVGESIQKIAPQLLENVDVTNPKNKDKITEAWSSLFMGQMMRRAARANFDPTLQLLVDVQVAQSTHALRLTEQLRQAEIDGTLPDNITQMLEEMVGLDPVQRQENREREAAQEAEATFREEFEKGDTTQGEPTMAVETVEDARDFDGEFSIADVTKAIKSGDTNTPLKGLNNVIRGARELEKRQQSRVGRPKARGKSKILIAIQRQAEAGNITEEQATELTDFVNRIDKRLLEDVGVSFRKNLNANGLYNFLSNIVTVATQRGRFTDTAVHEFWHSLTRFIPSEQVNKMREEYKSQLARHLKRDPMFYAFVGRSTITAETKQKLEAEFGKDAVNARVREIVGSQNFKILFSEQDYRFVNLDEFVVENLRDVTLGKKFKMAKPTSFWMWVSDLFYDFANMMKRVFGMDQFRKFESQVMNTPQKLDKQRWYSLTDQVGEGSQIEDRLTFGDVLDQMNEPTMAVEPTQEAINRLAEMELAGPRIRTRGAEAAKRAMQRILQKEIDELKGLEEYSYAKASTRLNPEQRIKLIRERVRAIAKMLPNEAINKEIVNSILSDDFLDVKPYDVDSIGEKRAETLAATQLRKRIQKALRKFDEVLDKYIKRENIKQIDKIIKSSKPRKDKKGNLSFPVDKDSLKLIERAEEIKNIKQPEEGETEPKVTVEKERAAAESRIEQWIAKGQEYQDMLEKGVTEDDLYDELNIVNLFGYLNDPKERADRSTAALEYLTKIRFAGRENIKAMQEARSKADEKERSKWLGSLGLAQAPSRTEQQNMRTEMNKKRNAFASVYRYAKKVGYSLFTLDGNAQYIANLKPKGKKKLATPQDLSARIARAGRNYQRIYGNRTREPLLFLEKEYKKKPQKVVMGWKRTEKTFSTRSETTRKEATKKINYQNLAEEFNNLGIDEQIQVLIEVGNDTISVDGVKVSVAEIIDGIQNNTATQEQLDALSKKNKNINYTFFGERGKGADMTLNVMQALHVSMMAEQEQVREIMEIEGKDQQFLDDIEAFLVENDAIKFKEFLFEQFDNSYNEFAEVYERLFFGVLPKVDRYVPMKHITADDYAQSLKNNTSIGGTMRPGATKERVQKLTKSPEFLDVFDLYMRHFAEMDYWQTHAELGRELMNTLGHESVLAAVGKEIDPNFAIVLQEQIKTFLGAGQRSAVTHELTNTLVRRALSGKAIMGLALQPKTILISLDSAHRSLYVLPIHVHAKYSAKAFSSPETLRELFNSEVIRLRVEEGMSPETRQLIQEARASGVLDGVISKGMIPLQYTDAFGTYISSAPLWEYYKEKGSNQGLDGKALIEFVENMVDRDIQRYSQPNRRGSLSLMEQQANGFIFQSFTQFKSDLRQSWQIEVEAVRDIIGITNGDKGMAFQKLIVNRVIRPTMFWFFQGIFLSAFGDEEDEERAFSLSNLLFNIAAGPLAGAYVFGEIGVIILSLMFKEKVYDNSILNLAQALQRAKSFGTTVTDLIEGEQIIADTDVEKLAKDFTSVLGHLGGPLAGLYPLVRLAELGQNGATNLLEMSNRPGIYWNNFDKFKALRKEIKDDLEEIRERKKEILEQLKENPNSRELKREFKKVDKEFKRANAAAYQKIWKELAPDEKESFLDKTDAPKYVRKKVK